MHSKDGEKTPSLLPRKGESLTTFGSWRAALPSLTGGAGGGSLNERPYFFLIQTLGVFHTINVHHKQPAGLGIGVLAAPMGEVCLPRDDGQTLLQLGACLVVLLGCNLLEQPAQGRAARVVLKERLRADHAPAVDVRKEIEPCHQAASFPFWGS